MSTLRLLPLSIALIACILTACGDKDAGGIDIGNTRYYPTLSTDSVSTFVSDSGYTRYHITADRWLMYEEADTPFWKFPDGLYLERFDDTMAIVATFRADSAIYLSTLKIWRFDGRVNMRNTEGDRFATPTLFWNQNTKTVYSDSFMHIERAGRVIEGYGFESNEQITEYTVRRPQMILPVERKRVERTDSAPAAPPRQASPDAAAPQTPRPESRPAPESALVSISDSMIPILSDPIPISSDTTLIRLKRHKWNPGS